MTPSSPRVRDCGPPKSSWRGAAPLATVLICLGFLAVGAAQLAPEPARPSSKSPSAKRQPAGVPASAAKHPYTTETLRGKVVWLGEALERLYGVATEPAAAESSVVLETPEGHLWPIIPDTRGQSFAVDARLRDKELELPVRRYRGVSLVQVIRVLQRRADGLYEIDYWCDVCAIPMYILKPCECCQGATRRREQLIEMGSGKSAP
jgi:hypothetical protein